jgi:RimJ/RimL family protein N-acetyltransferase
MGGIEISPFREMPEVSYLFAPDCWGQGLATEFARAAIDYGFRVCGLSEIGASFDPENKASMRVAEKVGMRFLSKGTDEYDLPTIFYVIRKPDE